MIKSDPHVSLRSLDIPVNVVTTVLKNFFSSSDQPIFPLKFYNLVDEAVGGVLVFQNYIHMYSCFDINNETKTNLFDILLQHGNVIMFM